MRIASSIIADSIDCDIISNYGSPSATDIGYLGVLTTNTGDFKGKLMSRGIGIPGSAQPFGVSLARDLVGTIDVADSVQGASDVPAITIGRYLASSSLIRIGETLSGNSSDGGVSVSATGLKGQVLLNTKTPSSSTSSSRWAGHVRVGTGGSQVDLSPPPYYAQASASLAGLSAGEAGGAVATAPYKIYANDCVPAHYNDWNYDYDADHWPPSCSPNEVLLSSYFCVASTNPNKQRAKVRFYGPVWTPALATDDEYLQPYQVLEYVAVDPYQVFWADITEAMSVTMGRTEATASREITVSAKNGHRLPAGFYAVVFNTQEPTTIGEDPYSIRCAGTAQSPGPAPVANVSGLVAYYFRLYPDCNSDGCVDSWDHRCPMTDGTCYADLAGSSDSDSCTPTGCATPDGGVDISDLLYFLAGFESGCTCVDLDDGSGTGNPDYGVDISDLLFFLAHFEAGC